MEPYRLQEVRLSLVRSEEPTLTIRNSRDVAQVFQHLASDVRESLYAMVLNGANQAICVDHLSTGSAGETIADPAEIIRTALLVAGRAIVLIHNHPSGVPTPSAHDRRITQAVADAAALFQLRLLDHVIIGARGRHYSFADQGVLPAPRRGSPGTPPDSVKGATEPPPRRAPSTPLRDQLCLGIRCP
jgi:DNA repair protein RadC